MCYSHLLFLLADLAFYFCFEWQDLQPIDRFVVEEYLLDVLFFLNGCRKECAAYMVGLPVPFRYEYLMAETIFSQTDNVQIRKYPQIYIPNQVSFQKLVFKPFPTLKLLLLPQPPFRPIYYTLVIIDLCKALPGAFPAVIAGAVRALFDKITDLDMECRTRLILWFSHHLSNFQFIWPWEEWAYVLDLPKWAPQRVFVQEVLEREVRLSYWDKIKQSIENAPALEELLPPRGGPQFKYNAEDGTDPTERTLSLELKDMVKGRKTAREMISWVEENVFPAHGFDITLGVVVQTLLDIGSKSFTHLITVLERYGQVIAKMCTDDDQQVKLIMEVSSYWQNSAQMTAIAIDRMMSYRLISNLAIVRWVFSPLNLDRFHVSDSPWEVLVVVQAREKGMEKGVELVVGGGAGWDVVGGVDVDHLIKNKKMKKILRNAVSKTYNRISDLRKEISSLERSVVFAERAASRAGEELESAESKLSVIDGEPVLGENPVRIKRLKLYAEKAKEEEVSVRESLEAKEALLTRAVDEIEALFLSLYKSFLTALAEPLHDASRDGTLRPSGHADDMTIDLEDSSVMELDKDDERPKKSHPNGSGERKGYNLDEKQQWCFTTLGYLKAFTRQYASEIWQHIEKLDAEVLTEDTHPLVRKAIYCGLRRPLEE
ncbi:hypothetical protein H5410_049423 [Solanum commersonii]|uniref:ABH1 n=1 Tax=Solanum commersonii TaxID=4109 RepID=A0A9J5WUL0_SOLCO|nr:hypothetical protein H5410_049423 [Solanum commersonii]